MRLSILQELAALEPFVDKEKKYYHLVFVKDVQHVWSLSTKEEVVLCHNVIQDLYQLYKEGVNSVVYLLEEFKVQYFHKELKEENNVDFHVKLQDVGLIK